MPNVSSRGPMYGVNLIEDAKAPFGSEASFKSMQNIRKAGFRSVAIIPFFWQPSGSSPDIVQGSALPKERLRAGISAAHEIGLNVIVKPHVWVPDSWAGSVRMKSEGDWQKWFAAYQATLVDVAAIAQEQSADALIIGTELRGSSHHAKWFDIIHAVRSTYAGKLTYVAHGSNEALKVPFWDQLDAVSASLYPSMGDANSPSSWQEAMDQELFQATALAQKLGKPFWLGEFGLRSAEDATLKPWESAEERAALPAPQLQLEVLKKWGASAKVHGVEQALVWRWISDPNAGGAADTDFTIQGKPAQDLLRHLD